MQAQHITEAKHIIDTLTSEYFSGRGVVGEGEKKAALFIAHQFSRMGVEPVGQDYLQSFQYPINSFSGALNVALDEKTLIPGKDFLVDPKSQKMQGVFEVIWYTYKNVPTKKQLKKLVRQRFFESKVLVIDEWGWDDKTGLLESLKMNTVGAAGLILIEEEKLTHHLSQTYFDYFQLKVLRSAIKKGAKQIAVHIDQEFLPAYTSQNVIGQVTGSEYPDSIIVISAHYDHLGKMGEEVYFPGANDNASGIAMLLSLADYYAHQNPPTKTIVFMAFGAEESGLVGSKYYTEHPLFPLQKINFMINVDIMGTGDEGIQVVNGTEFKGQFDQLVQINEREGYLKQVKIRGKAANSDHYWFAEKGVPAFFIYTLGGIKAYHDIYDVSSTLPLTEFEDCFKLITGFVDEL